jgi:hypothetical protein
LVLDIDGKRFYTTLPDDVDSAELVTLLVSSSSEKPLVLEKSATEPTQEPVEYTPSFVQVAEEPEAKSDVQVNWTEIPDEFLSTQLKKALTFLNVPSLVYASKLQELTGQIIDEFGPEEWEAVGVSYPQQPTSTPEPLQVTSSPVPRAQPVPSVAQQVNTVTWQDGTPIVPGLGKPARTIPMDDYGYPIVSGGDRDVGEVLGSGGTDVDESGVQQF